MWEHRMLRFLDSYFNRGLLQAILFVFVCYEQPTGLPGSLSTAKVLAVPSSTLSPSYSPIQYRLLPGNASAIMGLQFTKDVLFEFFRTQVSAFLSPTCLFCLLAVINLYSLRWSND